MSIAAGVACAPGGQISPVYDRQTRALLRLDYDYDSNGTVDVRTYMRDGRPFRLEGDANNDGLVDRWEYYGTSGQLERVGGSTLGDGHEDTWAYASGDDLRLDLSTARDGVVDRREFYRSNVLVRTESDANRDGRPDMWEAYDDGRLTEVLADDDKTHGRPTRRLVYTAGAEPRVEIDPDGDGQFTSVAAAPPSDSKEHVHVTR